MADDPERVRLRSELSRGFLNPEDARRQTLDANQDERAFDPQAPACKRRIVDHCHRMVLFEGLASGVWREPGPGRTYTIARP
jgi:hypothetical protein